MPMHHGFVQASTLMTDSKGCSMAPSTTPKIMFVRVGLTFVWSVSSWMSFFSNPWVCSHLYSRIASLMQPLSKHA